MAKKPTQKTTNPIVIDEKPITEIVGSSGVPDKKMTASASSTQQSLVDGVLKSRH